MTSRHSLGFRGIALAVLVSFTLLTACSSQGRNFQSTTLHFDLTSDNFLNNEEDYWLHYDGDRIVLQEHTVGSLNAYVENGGSADLNPSHFASVSLPEDRTMLLYVSQRSDNAGQLAAAFGAGTPQGLALPFIYVPTSARLDQLSSTQSALQTPKQQDADSDGCHFSSGDTANITAEILNTYTPCDIAKTIVYHHPELLNLDSKNAAIVMQHLETAEGLTELALAIKSAGQHGWYDLEPVLKADGEQFTNSKGEKVYKYLVKEEIRSAATTVLQNTLNATKNDASLKGVTYNVIDGTSSIDQSSSSETSSYTLQRQSSTTGTTFKISSEGPQPGLDTSVENVDDQDVTIKFTNHYIRHLSAYVEFYDEDDKIITPSNWDSKLSFVTSADRARLESDTTKFLTLINPPSTFMSIPVDPGEESVTFTMPAEATYAMLYAGGLGIGGDRNSMIEEMGVALTATFELGIPTFLLASTAALTSLGSVLRAFYLSSAIISDVVKNFFALVWGTGSTSFADILSRITIFMGDLIVRSGFQFIITLLAEAIAEDAAEDAIPFVGWIMNAVNIANTVSLLAQTTAEVASSPWMIENRLNATHDIKVTIDHDPNDFEFPATATHYIVTAQFSKHDAVVIRNNLPDTTVSDPIEVTFEDVPSGGTVNIIVGFYAADDWLAGHGEADTVTNITPDGDAALDVSITITEELVPLDSDSIYTFKEKLEYSGGAHKWVGGTAPTETLADLDDSETGNALSALVDIQIAQKVGALAYAWRGFAESVKDCSNTSNTGQLYPYQVISATADPETGLKFSDCGLEDQPYMIVELLGDSDGSGMNFVIEPNADGNFYVRRFELDDSGAFSLSSSMSYGRFPNSLDSAVLHPKGYILGINRATSKIYSVKLATSAVADDSAPEAILFGGPALSLAGAAANANLLVNPVAVALGTDGQLLILETIRDLTSGTSDSEDQGRLRAFSEFGHPIPYFGESDDLQFGAVLKSETEDATYLDIGVESKGYIYVLSYVGDGDKINDYRLDIYNPDGSFLVRTTGANAARMTVDLWRNVYTLNFETIIGPGDRTEPSVSQWIPPAP